MSHVVFVSGSDWTGLYLDGKLVDEGHSFHPPYVIRDHLIGKTIESCFQFEVDSDWMEAQGSLPETLKEIPEEVFIV